MYNNNNNNQNNHGGSNNNDSGYRNNQWNHSTMNHNNNNDSVLNSYPTPYCNTIGRSLQGLNRLLLLTVLLDLCLCYKTRHHYHYSSQGSSGGAVIISMDIIHDLIGYNTNWISFLLFVQTFLSFVVLNGKENIRQIYNNNPMTMLSNLFLPTELMVGVIFGTTVGAIIIVQMMNQSYQNISSICTEIVGNVISTSSSSSSTMHNSTTHHDTKTLLSSLLSHDPVLQYVCTNSKIHKTMKAIIFYTRCIFILKFITTFYIISIRQELVVLDENSYSMNHGTVPPFASVPVQQQQPYSTIPSNDLDQANHTNNPNQTHPPPTPPYQSTGPVFGRGYATIPEITPMTNSNNIVQTNHPNAPHIMSV